MKIPENWQGVLFQKSSSLSLELSNSSQLQNQVRCMLSTNNHDFLSKRLPIELSEDRNLHYSIGHATILNPHIDNDGYFRGILFDKYDYEFINSSIKDFDLTKFYNNSAFILQKVHLLKNYYLIVPIEFKW